MYLKITLYNLFIFEEGCSHSSRIHKCQCANILCYNIRLPFSSFLCSLELFLTPFASFPKPIIVDIGEKQLKLFSRPHEQMLGAKFHWFSLTTPREGTKVRMAKWSKAKEGTKHLDIKESQWTLIVLILQKQRLLAMTTCINIQNLGKASWTKQWRDMSKNYFFLQPIPTPYKMLIKNFKTFYLELRTWLRILPSSDICQTI